MDQYSTYHYPSPKDLKPDQSEKEIKPVKTNDDAMDAARYCTVMTYHLSEGKRPVKDRTELREKEINKLSHEQVIELRKRPKRFADERWS